MYVCVCVRACVRACARACVCACVTVVYAYETASTVSTAIQNVDGVPDEDCPDMISEN